MFPSRLLPFFAGKKIFSFFVFLSFTTTLFSQSDLNKTIPFDPNVRKGILPNGLTYYVRKNVKPEHRAELRLAVNAGSILESDQQQGLAHLAEHMAFNGTKNFQKNELVNFLERSGVRFGADLNAYTDFDETVYMLQIPTDTEAIFDKAFQVLVDWAHNVTYDHAEIDKERGVVIEEWRLGQGAGDRMRRQYFPDLFKDSHYADRITIGKKEIIQNAPYDTLIKFYKDWYRPDLMAVIAVGDFDPDKVVQMIKDNFSSLTNPQNERPRVNYPVPDQTGLIVSIARDKEATYTGISIDNKLPYEAVKTVADYRKSLMQQLYSNMLNARYSEMTQQPNPPFSFANASYSLLTRTKAEYANFAVVKDNGADRGLQALLEENERVKKFGFTQTELDRAKKEMLRNSEQDYMERNKTESRNYIREYVSNFLEGEPSPGIEWEFNTQQQLLPGIALNEVNQLAIPWVTDGKNSVVIITAPDKPGIIIPTVDQVKEIFRKAQQADLTAYIDKVSDKPLLSKQPIPSKVEQESKIDLYNITEWTLGNGVKVILKPTDFKNDEILMSGFAYGGTSLVGDKDYVSASLASSIINNSGVGNYDEVQLEKYLSDKVVDVGSNIGDLQETMNGSASPKDLETMMQLIYLYFTQPRKDSAGYNATMSQMLGFIQNQNASPEATFRDTIQLIMNDHSFRYQPMDEQRLKQVDLNTAYDIYKQRFSNGSEWTFVFVGSFTPEQIKPLVETYLGGLPTSEVKQTYQDLGIRPPKGFVDRAVYKGTEPKSAVYLAFTGPFDYTRHNRNEASALQRLLSIKLREVLREDMSGVYGVSITPTLKHYPRSMYQMTIAFGCAPENVDKLVAAAFRVVDSVKTFGCNSVDLQKVKEIMLKEREVNMKENSFWLSGLTANYANGENIMEIKDYTDQINSLTSDDFKRLAKQYFDLNNYVKCVLYPQKS